MSLLAGFLFLPKEKKRNHSIIVAAIDLNVSFMNVFFKNDEFSFKLAATLKRTNSFRLLYVDENEKKEEEEYGKQIHRNFTN